MNAEPNYQAIDIAIIGAGPAGTSAAITLARQGHKVVVFDKATFPRDKTCGDGLTASALVSLQSLGLDPSTVPNWQWVDKFTLAGPNAKPLSFTFVPETKGARTQFCAVVPRLDLDNALLKLAKDLGVVVHEGYSLTALSSDVSGVKATFSSVGTSEDTSDGGPQLAIWAKHLIAADGMWSPTRKLIESSTKHHHSPKPYLGEWHAMRQYIRGVNPDASRELTIWFEPDLLPGYAWSFPLPDGTINFGFGIERHKNRPTKEMKSLWNSLLEREHIKLILGDNPVFIDTPKAWPIPANIGSARLTHRRVLFVGDAARACDVLTGEGIGQALTTGAFAAKAIIGSVKSSRPADAGLFYGRMVEADMMANHKMAKTLSRLISNRFIAQLALTISAKTAWTSQNFARWLFEDYPRGIALTPRSWRWGLLGPKGAYSESPEDSNT